MTAVPSEAALPIARRLWIYQRERFPLARTALLLAVFTAASINVSAHLAGRALPSWPSYLVAFVVGLVFFFQLRACDEIKDADDDRRYRPERPIPRGLVELRLIVGLGLAAVPLAALATAALDPHLLWPLALVWLWMALMAAEFFVPEWLKARPFLYLVSHMLIMPLIDLFVTACEWLRVSGSPPPGLWLFLVLSFLNGCVLEIGRKIYAPGNERTGVETYSALLGPRNATLLWGAILAAAFAFLLAVGAAIGAPRLVGAIGLLGLAACLAGGLMFWHAGDAAGQTRIDTMSGLWVLTCYGAAGFAPLLARWIVP
jgi:4-hydroxybenzoate polyprenyltransferase